MLLVGCGGKSLDISFEQPACSAGDTGSAEDFSAELIAEDTVLASRLAVEQPCSATFVPEVTVVSRDLVEIREYWQEGASSDCTTCFSPGVELTPVSGRELEIHWYVGDETLPSHVAEVPLR